VRPPRFTHSVCVDAYTPIMGLVCDSAESIVGPVLTRAPDERRDCI
jgi:hypothetical protein